MHYVADAANTSAKRARQRLALDRTPEVKILIEQKNQNNFRS